MNDKAVLLQGDCLEILKELPDNSVDSLVTDPPAGISFMGKAWDEDKGGRKQWIAWMSEVMTECLRVLKPGAHGLVWAIPRTSHWTASALEDAGFEIRDVVTHVFGSGFPKSLDISKAIDKAAGAEREVIGENPRAKQQTGQKGTNSLSGDRNPNLYLTAPSTPEAKQWQGFGTALKPASEHWVLVRKPCSEKTVAANVLKHGTGGINIDASRIGAAESQGRFPANFVLSHNPNCEDVGNYEGETSYHCTPGCAVAELDRQSLAGGMHGAGKARPAQKHQGDFGVGDHGSRIRLADHRFGDSGGASRFFYCSKASKKDKNSGLEDLPLKESGIKNGSGRGFSESDPHKKVLNQNTHPTVKSSVLMAYLIKLITPPGGVVLDPFMGSGSTGVAAVKEGFDFIGIEKEDEYIAIASKRIE